MTHQTAKRAHGLGRLMAATRNSWKGFKRAYQDEAAFRQELWLCLLLAPLGWWLGQTWFERTLLWGSLLLVLIVELLNTGIEAAIDRVSLEHHDLSGKAKDVASAAVLLSLLLCTLAWVSAAIHRCMGAQAT